MKGMVLAGGRATRLFPVTKAVSKHLLPIYDKPMIYYPLSVLLLAGIRDILIISTQNDIGRYRDLLGDGSQVGVRIEYAVQQEPRGIADAFIIGEKFIDTDSVCLILGDNILYGHNLTEVLTSAAQLKEGATIFCYYVKDPERYGVVALDSEQHVQSIVEKPKQPPSNWAITGLYFYDNQVVRLAKALKPSSRGELEITDINKAYLQQKQLTAKFLGRGYAWLDTGTHDSLIDASTFIKTIEERQGLKVGCIEEIAFRMKFISRDQLLSLSKGVYTNYGDYLLRTTHEEK